MVKKIFFLIVFCIWFTNNFVVCQNKCDTVNLDLVCEGFEELPKFDIAKFLVNNLKYPETAIKDSKEGRVSIRFWIDENGFTSEHEIIKGVREDCDEEVLRVAKLIIFDKPAMSGGRPIGTCFQFYVSFSLSESVNKSRRWKFQRR